MAHPCIHCYYEIIRYIQENIFSDHSNSENIKMTRFFFLKNISLRIKRRILLVLRLFYNKQTKRAKKIQERI